MAIKGAGKVVRQLAATDPCGKAEAEMKQAELPLAEAKANVGASA